MPSGYTHKVAEGKIQDLTEFTIDCSRAFGALVHMRDDSSDSKISLPEDSTYYSDSIISLQEKKEQISIKSNLEILDFMKKSYTDDIERKTKSIEKDLLIKSRYQSMLEKVISWNPPTEDHEGLKKFMIDQLTESIKFDCLLVDDYKKEIEETKIILSTIDEKSAIEWKKERLDDIDEDIKYHNKKLEEERERNNGRKKWIFDLVKSLDITEEKKSKLLDFTV